MKVRSYQTADCAELAELFYETVHTVNANDYTKQQLAVWATGKIDIAAWDQSFTKHNTLVAQANNSIVGFGDMDHNGYLDRLYVHKDHQGEGVATAIVNELEQQAAKNGISIFTTHASITAKPFFERRGYHIVRENKVKRNGVELLHFIMEKRLEKET